MVFLGSKGVFVIYHVDDGNKYMAKYIISGIFKLY